MIIKNILRNNKILLLLFFLITLIGNAQIGIGTVTPNASSILDVSSTSKGLLTPRMTTLQRNAITTPADGLMVYDTDLKLLYYFSSGTSTWLPINSGTGAGRTNYKLVKSVADLAPELVVGGGSKYVLNTSTFYEINGTIVFNFPVDLNNAYVVGADANEDKLVRASGNLFDGANGGTIKNVTIVVTSGKVFNLNGATTENLLLRDSIIANSSNVGSITGFGLVFVSVVQYVNNATGIVYDTISKLLIDNAAWFGSNQGVYEKVQGIFGLIQKQGGFSEVLAGSIGFDVSANPTINGDAIMESVVFTGANTAGYVNKYGTGTYPGYNFTNSWSVRCAGIPTETDAVATGDINLSAAVGSGAQTTFPGTGAANRIKLAGTTTSNSLFRFLKDGNNRIVYKGNKTRYFQITASVSYQGSDDSTIILYIAKNGTVITDTKVYGKGATGFFVAAGILALPIVGTVELKKEDSIEIWAERYAGTGNMQTVSLNLTAR